MTDSTSLDFPAFLAELDRGNVSAELATKLLELIDSVRETRKSGHLTFKLTAGWDAKAEMLRLGTSVTGKTPVLDRPESLFFVTKDGRPTKHDPRQLALIEANERHGSGVVDFSEPRHAN